MRPRVAAAAIAALCAATLTWASVASAWAETVGDFTIEGGTSGQDYAYSGGVLTIKSGTPLTISNTNSSTMTNDRIVISSGVNANLTLNGVNINAPVQTSAIDVSSGASLTLTLANGSQNTLAVTSTNTMYNNAGIHVPSNASLTIQCAAAATGGSHQCAENGNCGQLSVTGGVASGNGYGGAGIGGNGTNQSGEQSGSVSIIGGQVTTMGGTAAYAGAGIGGGTAAGTGGGCGPVYITGGQVIITGGQSNSSGTGYGGAGIGGGSGNIGDGGDGGIVVITGGNVQVTGGSSSSSSGRGGAGIGGGIGQTFSSISGNGGDGGTVVILVPGVTVQGGAGNIANGTDIGGGTAAGGGSSGYEGQGIKPDSNGNYTVYGNPTLPNPPDTHTIPEGATLTIPSGSSLTVPEGTELVVDGTLEVETGSSLSNSGTISGSGTLTGDGTVTNNGNGSISVSDNDFAANVSLSITSGGSSVSSVTYGSTVTLTANVTDGSGAVNSGTVYFYQGSNTSGTPLNSGGTNVNSGKASYSLTLNDASWTPSETAYTITAVYTPGQDSGLLSGSDDATLTVSKGTQATPPDALNVATATTNSVTLAAVSGENIEYGYTTGTGGQPGNWQTETTFNDLSAGTDYTFYTRYAETDYYEASGPSTTGLTVTTLPDITTTSLGEWYVGVENSVQLSASVASGKTVTWALASGSTLPDGLTLEENGVITGTSSATATSHNFTVQATISGGADGTTVSNTKELSITISAGTPDITATTYKGEDQTNTFTYGDTITVSGKIAASATVPGTSTNAIAQNQVGLYLGKTELATATVTDGNFSLTYDTSGKDVPIGKEQTLTVKYGGSSDLSGGSTTVRITLNKKSVTAQVQGVITKVYDGNTSATVNLAVASSDLVNDTDVITVTGAGTYQRAEVGSNISVTVSNIQTDGADKDWYSVSAPSNVYGSITQSGSSLAVEPSSTSLTYGDTFTLTVKPSTTGKEPEQNVLLAGLRGLVDLLTGANGDTVELYNGDKVLAGTSEKNEDGSYTLTYSTADKGLSVGENTLTVKFNGDTNLAASEETVTVNLSAKKVAATATAPIKTYNGKADVTVDLNFANGVLVGGDSLTGTVEGTFADANAGEGKAITLDGATVKWSNATIAGFYQIALPTGVTGTINPANIEEQKVDIAGSVVFGEVLKAEYTRISDEEVAYQWTRDGVKIDGATSETYQVTVDDIDSKLAVVVTPTDSNHTGRATSAPVMPTACALNVTNVTAKPDTGATTTTDVTLTATLGNGVSGLVPPGVVQLSYVAADADEGAKPTTIGTAEVKADAEGNLSASLTWNNVPAGTWKIVAMYAPAETDGYATGETGALASFNVSKTAQTGFGFAGDGVEQGAGGAFTLRTTYAPDATIKLQTTGGQGSGKVTFAVTSGTDVLELAEDGQTVRVLKSGTAVVTATKAADDTYHATTATLTVTADRAEGHVEITTATLDKTYDGKVAEAPEYKVAGDGDVAVTWYRLDGDNATQLEEAPADAGTYRVTVSAAETDCYTVASDSMTFKIAPASLAGAVKVEGSSTYGETLAASYDGSADAGSAAVSWQWLRDGKAIDGAVDTSYTVDTEDVGCKISVRATAADGNHTGAVTSKAARVEARSLDVASVAAASDGAATATGSVTLTATLANALDGDEPAGVVQFMAQVAGAGDVKPQVVATAPVTRTDDGTLVAQTSWNKVPAGTWDITAVYVPAEDDWYAAGDSAVLAGYNIAKAEQDALVFTVAGAKDGKLALTFAPGATFELAVDGGSGSGAVSYAVAGDGVLALDGTTATVLHAGTATITVTKAGDADYNAASVTLVVTVAPAELGGTVAVAGDAVVGETLTATYDGPVAAVAWQWLRDGKEIADATGARYTLGADDVGCTLTVRATSLDGDYAGSVESAATDKVAKADQAAPTGLAGVAEAVAGSNGGRITGLVSGVTYEVSRDDGKTWETPKRSEDGTAAVGLAAGTYLARLAETATHAAGDATSVVVPSFSAAHGGIEYPDGSTAGDDGTVTLPEEGGAVTFPGDVEIGLPGGSVVSPDKPAATLPEGGGTVTFPDGSQVVLPGGSVVNGSSATTTDGTVVRPDGEGGLVVVQPDGTELAAPSGSTIDADGSVTDPDGNPVEPEEPGSDEPSDDDTKPSESDDKPSTGDDERGDASDNKKDKPAASTDEAGRLSSTGDVATVATAAAAATGLGALALGLFVRRRS